MWSVCIQDRSMIYLHGWNIKNRNKHFLSSVVQIMGNIRRKRFGKRIFRPWIQLLSFFAPYPLLERNLFCLYFLSLAVRFCKCLASRASFMEWSMRACSSLMFRYCGMWRSLDFLQSRRLRAHKQGDLSTSKPWLEDYTRTVLM